MDSYSNVLEMGGSVPVSTVSNLALKLPRSISSKPESGLIESSTKKNIVNVQNSIATAGWKPHSSPISRVASSRESSAKEEMYFDPLFSLESDCEDFFSVSGDTTPPRDNSPIHQSRFREIPQFDQPLYVDGKPSSIPEPPPKDMKKKLFELFRESFRGDTADDSRSSQARPKDRVSVSHILPKSTNITLDESTASSACSIETTLDESYSSGRGKLAKSAGRCLPNLVRSLSFSGRRKRLSLANYKGR